MIKHIGAIVKDVVEAILLAIVLFFVLRIGVQSTVVEGSSMFPNFVDGEWVLVNKLAYRWNEPIRGDVIVFSAPDEPGKDYIKRIVALSGETVQIRSGRILIDDVPLDEPWLPVLDERAFGPFRVPEGHVFVMGDNRPHSNDSRSWVEPELPLDRVVGKVWISVWPIETWGLVESDRPAPASAGGSG